MNINENTNYIAAVQQMKTAILKSRYVAASLVNKELLKMYFGIGHYDSFHSRNKNWGKGAIDTISSLLQQELNGLRGFSTTNIKNMRIFYEEWEFLQSFLIDKEEPLFQFSEEELNRQLPSADLNSPIRQIPTDELIDNFLIRQMPSADLEKEWLELFLKVPFSQQRIIIKASDVLEERVFYIQKVATEFWSYETLKHHLKSNLYQHQGKLAHNFQTTLPENSFKERALMAFKDEMLLDFINIEDADEEPNERVFRTGNCSEYQEIYNGFGCRI